MFAEAQRQLEQARWDNQSTMKESVSEKELRWILTGTTQMRSNSSKNWMDRRINTAISGAEENEEHGESDLDNSEEEGTFTYSITQVSMESRFRRIESL